jgi:hypothetical protein
MLSLPAPKVSMVSTLLPNNNSVEIEVENFSTPQKKPK